MATTTRTGQAAASGYDPGVTPNWSFFPFMDPLRDLVGGTMATVILALVGVAALGGFAWAIGNMWDHGRASQAGKATLVITLAAAFVVGGASALVRWMAGLGGGLA